MTYKVLLRKRPNANVPADRVVLLYDSPVKSEAQEQYRIARQVIKILNARDSRADEAIFSHDSGCSKCR